MVQRTTYWHDIAVLAVPAEGVIAKAQVIDLTAKMDASGMFERTAPAGKWLIYRFGRTAMGAHTQPNQLDILGLECDTGNPSRMTINPAFCRPATANLARIVATNAQSVIVKPLRKP